MSDNFWKKLSQFTGLFVITTIFGMAIFAANLEIKDLDLWLHIGMGRFIVQHGFVPGHDVLSCTIFGHPWINHEWLFQVVVYLIYHAAGPNGLITMQVVLVAITMTILLILGYNKNKQLASIFGLLLVVLVYEQRFTIRPDLYSLLFFALYIFILSFYLNRRWSLYALMAIQVLWVNFHGFFFFGPLFVVIGLTAEWLKRHVPLPYAWNTTARLNNDEYRRLKGILFVVLMACLINPMTIKGALYPLKVFFAISGKDNIVFKYVVELKRPMHWGDILTLKHAYYKVLIIISFLSFVYNRYKIDIGVLFFWLVFLGFSLVAIRNLTYFAFAAYLVFITNVTGLTLRDVLPLRISDKKFVYLLGIVVKVLILVWVLQYIITISANGYWDFAKYQRKSEYGGVSERNFPDKAVDFLVKNHVRGNFFNDFNSGAYLVGRCFPNIKVYIDGRTEVYGPAFLRRFLDIWDHDNVKPLKEDLKKYHITGALLNSVEGEIPPKVLDYFQKSKQWIPVYLGYDGMIYLKDVPKNRRVIEAHRLDLKHWKPPMLDLNRLGPMGVIPYQFINRAYTLRDLGYYNAAEKEAKDALKINPTYREPYKLLGQIAAAYHKNFKQAIQYFRIAVMLNHEDIQTQYNLAHAYYDSKNYKYAVKRYQAILDRWPGQARAWFWLARTYAMESNNAKALDALHRARKLDSGNIRDVLAIGDVFFKKHRLDIATRVYNLVAHQKKASAGFYLRMGRIFKAKGEVHKAAEEWMRGLAANPQDNEIRNELNRLNDARP